MGNIILSFTNKKQKPTKKEKVILTRHNETERIPEYYSYIDSNNVEQNFNDTSYIIAKVSSSKIIAKKTTVSKINLDFIEAKESIKEEPGYFTYDGNKKYIGKPEFDDTIGSYVGVFNSVNVYDKEIKLYEEI